MLHQTRASSQRKYAKGNEMRNVTLRMDLPTLSLNLPLTADGSVNSKLTWSDSYCKLVVHRSW